MKIATCVLLNKKTAERLKPSRSLTKPTPVSKADVQHFSIWNLACNQHVERGYKSPYDYIENIYMIKDTTT